MIGRVIEALKREGRTVITSHLNPEADAIGSVMALGLALESIGRTPYLYNVSGVPRNLKGLPKAKSVSNRLPAWKPEILAVLDCGDFSRIGKEASEAYKDVPMIINIDHHPTNDGFGHIRWVEPQRSSTGELIACLIDEMGVKWSPDMATWILAAIIADTGSFKFSNTRAETFHIAGNMVSYGAKPDVVATNLFGNLPEKVLKLLTMVLGTLEVDRKRKIASVRVTQEMFRQTGTGPEDIEGFVEYPRTMENIKVAALFRENNSGGYKVSMRSNGSVDVGAVSVVFGGGGHAEAAGFSIQGDFEHAKGKLMEALLNAVGNV